MVDKNGCAHIALFSRKTAMNRNKPGGRAYQLVYTNDSTRRCALPDRFLVLDPFVSGLASASLAIGATGTGGRID